MLQYIWMQVKVLNHEISNILIAFAFDGVTIKINENK